MRLPATSSTSSRNGGRSSGVDVQERPSRRVVLACRGHRDQLALRPAQRRQPAPEDGAGVDVDRVVDPLGLGHRGVAVDDGRLAAVVRRPGASDREAELVGLPRRLAEQREIAHPARPAALVALRHARVRHHEAPVVEHDVRDEAVQERADLVPERLRLLAQLLERLGQPVGDLRLAPRERPRQLDVVVARHADRGARLDHPHHEPQHRHDRGSTVDEIAHEHRAAAVGVRPVDVAERCQQCRELVEAPVDVTDDVERPLLGAAVGPHRRADDLDACELLLRAQDGHAPEAVPLQMTEGTLEQPVLAADDVGTEGAIRSRRVALDAQRLGDVEHDRHREQVVRAGERQQRRPRLALHVGGVDDGQPAAAQPAARDLVQHRERVLGRALVVRVVGHEPAAEVRRDRLGREEVRCRERALAGAGGADQHDQTGVRKLDLHRSNTASWVGGPTTASSGPTGRKRTP